jgi:hypothetical protein
MDHDGGDHFFISPEAALASAQGLKEQITCRSVQMSKLQRSQFNRGSCPEIAGVKVGIV